MNRNSGDKRELFETLKQFRGHEQIILRVLGEFVAVLLVLACLFFKTKSLAR